jgi:hypothetical protein
MEEPVYPGIFLSEVMGAGGKNGVDLFSNLFSVSFQFSFIPSLIRPSSYESE